MTEDRTGKYDAFVFDLYGTLVDIRTDEDAAGLWRGLSEFYGSLGAHYKPSELKRNYRRMVSRETERQQRAGRERYGETYLAEPDLTAVFRQLYAERGVRCSEERGVLTAVLFRILSRRKLKVYDGVRETLLALRRAGKGVYLLSNAQRDFTRPEIELTGLADCFDGILISSEEGCKKPSPAFFDRLVERYGLERPRCLMTGNDERADVQGGAAAGMDTLYLHTETSPPLTGGSGADYAVMDGDWRRVSEILLAAAGIDPADL